MGANFGGTIVTNRDFTAYVSDSAATRPSSQITLGKLVLLDAPGETGKTLLLKMIFAKVRTSGIAIAVLNRGHFERERVGTPFSCDNV